MIKQKVNELLKLNKIPQDRKNKFSDNSFMYNFWYDIKKEKKCDIEPYIKLLSNEIFKKNYKNYHKSKT